MFTCKIENSKGDQLTLTQNESNFQVINIEGLNPPNAQINTSNIAGLDGARFNSSKLETRNIVIYIRLNGDVEVNRLNLYKYFPTKEAVTFYYKNNHRDVFIEGYVQTVEVALFSQSEVMQISILCPKSYFKAMEEIIDDASKVLNAFSFPFSINVGSPVVISTIDNDRTTNVYNDSESETGIIISIDVSNNVNKILIRNVDNGETFTLDNCSFVAGDMITINTNKGEKSVKLLRGGVTSNIFSKVVNGSTFFQLARGDNNFGYVVGTGDHNEYVDIRFKHRSIYRGV